MDMLGPAKPIVEKGTNWWKSYFGSWKTGRQANKDTINKMKAKIAELQAQNKTGGKIEGADVRDGLLGPVGWARLIMRKKQEKEKKKLQKQLDDLGWDGNL